MSAGIHISPVVYMYTHIVYMYNTVINNLPHTTFIPAMKCSNAEVHSLAKKIYTVKQTIQQTYSFSGFLVYSEAEFEDLCFE